MDYSNDYVYGLLILRYTQKRRNKFALLTSCMCIGSTSEHRVLRCSARLATDSAQVRPQLPCSVVGGLRGRCQSTGQPPGLSAALQRTLDAAPAHG